MNRRSFFAVLAGAPAVAAPGAIRRPTAARKSEPLVMALGYSATCGRCMGAMYQHGSWEKPADIYLTCERQHCPQYHVPLKVPMVECERANPVIADYGPA